MYRVFSSSDLKYITSFWFNGLFIDDLSCLLVVRTKYTNSYDKDSKYTNAVDISITAGSVGSAVGRAGGRGGGSVGGDGSFIASISATFFASFILLSLNLFIYFSLSLRAALTRLGSFVTFSDVLSMFTLKYKEKKLKQISIPFLNILFLIQPGKG